RHGFAFSIDSFSPRIPPSSRACLPSGLSRGSKDGRACQTWFDKLTTRLVLTTAWWQTSRRDDRVELVLLGVLHQAPVELDGIDEQVDVVEPDLVARWHDVG